MPRILIDLEKQEVKEVLERTKKNLKEGVEGIVREFLKSGKSLNEIADSKRFQMLLNEAFQSHFDRLLENLKKGVKIEGGDGSSVNREEVEEIVDEAVEEIVEEVIGQKLEELEEKFKKLRDGLIRELDRLKAVIGRDIESFTNITQKLEMEIEKEVLERLKEIEKVSAELKEKQKLMTGLFLDSVLAKLSEICKDLQTIKDNYQRLANYVGYKDLSCVGVHYKEEENESSHSG